MSRQADERKNMGKQTAKSGQKAKAKLFVSFHPTKEEKEYLRSLDTSLEDDLESLKFFMAEGHKITVGYSKNTGAVYATLREGTDDWEQARSVSAWHSEAGMALRALIYGVLHYHPKFPNLATSQAEFDLEW